MYFICRVSLRVRSQEAFCFDSTSAGPQQMCPVMSWLLCLCLWVSVTAIQLCQATFYDTIQQHHGTRPGRTTIHMIGESFAAVFSCYKSEMRLFPTGFHLIVHQRSLLLGFTSSSIGRTDNISWFYRRSAAMKRLTWCLTYASSYTRANINWLSFSAVKNVDISRTVSKAQIQTGKVSHIQRSKVSYIWEDNPAF